MLDIVFVVLFASYFIVAAKVEQWNTISILGFKSYTPEGFLRAPKVYMLVSAFLFSILFVFSFFTENIPLYISLFLVVIGWGVVQIVGRKQAFNNYREVHADLYASGGQFLDAPYNQEELAELAVESRITDKELHAKLIKFRKWGM
ncbi:MAG: hypothetical protein A3I83_06055 [Methylotenera sp. RIFCSPLOWO2_02_FULL_45_14]|nr:MAG: hypothetical protein A3I83_06055 [Methylotenera sp. RIFCSPLOWO2_02_FULL_45_14]